jgi:hypothetical protein
MTTGFKEKQLSIECNAAQPDNNHPILKIKCAVDATNKEGARQWIWIAHGDYKVKGKAIPLQALTDPEGSRRLRLPDKTIGT